jgi:hypothetical protein
VHVMETLRSCEEDAKPLIWDRNIYSVVNRSIRLIFLDLESRFDHFHGENAR